MEEFKVEILSGSELSKVKGGETGACGTEWVECSCSGYIGFNTSYNGNMSGTLIGDLHIGKFSY